MSDITQISSKKDIILKAHSRAYRLAAAVFTVSNLFDVEEELRTRLKRLSLDMVSMTVRLKDINFGESKKAVSEIESKCLELMSLIDIAEIAGLISGMNSQILKSEFNSFLVEIKKTLSGFSDDKRSVNSILSRELSTFESLHYLPPQDEIEESVQSVNLSTKNVLNNHTNGSNGKDRKRKDHRKEMILDFIKGHNDVSIKDIVPNVVGCSEKTVQRELIGLINEGKIKKVGERRWSKYSAT